MRTVFRAASNAVPRLVRYGATKEGGGQVVRAVTPELAKIIGSDSSTFRNAVSQVWVYIVDRKLQDPQDRMMVSPNEELKAVFPGHDKIGASAVSLLCNAV